MRGSDSVPRMSEDVLLERDAGVATITLNAPDRRNALTRAMARDLVAACEEVDADPAVGAVVVRGAGGFFCAGGDRQTLADAGRDPATPEAYAGIGDVYRSFQRVGELEPPTVAAIAVVIAAISNTLVKCGMVTTLGGPALRRPMLLTTAAVVAAGIAGVALIWLRQSS